MNNQSDWLISWRGTDLWNIRDIVLVIFSFLFLSYLFILFSIVQNDLWGILNVSNHDQSIRLVDFFQRALTSVKKVITLRNICHISYLWFIFFRISIVWYFICILLQKLVHCLVKSKPKGQCSNSPLPSFKYNRLYCNSSLWRLVHHR